MHKYLGNHDLKMKFHLINLLYNSFHIKTDDSLKKQHEDRGGV